MEIIKNKNPKQKFKGTVPNTDEGREFIRNMRKLGLKVRVFGRHSNRKALVGKMFHTNMDGTKRQKSLRDIQHNGWVPLDVAEYLSIYIDR